MLSFTLVKRFKIKERFALFLHNYVIKGSRLSDFSSFLCKRRLRKHFIAHTIKKYQLCLDYPFHEPNWSRNSMDEEYLLREKYVRSRRSSVSTYMKGEKRDQGMR